MEDISDVSAVVQPRIHSAKKVSLEDQKLIPEIQQNLQAGIYNEGPLSKKYETGVGFFHDLYLNKLNLEKTK